MEAKQKIFSDRTKFRNAKNLRKGFEIIDPMFQELIGSEPTIEKHWTGCEWAEGPAYLVEENSVVWSDVPNNRMLRFDATTGKTYVFREPSNFSNGNSIDPNGRLITCEHQTHSIVRRTSSENLSLVNRYNGKRLNSPNDLVAKSDGTIWFTDPPYGILTDREGKKRTSELGENYVFRFDPSTNDLDIITDKLDKPNGLAFSPDETKLYVSDTGEAGNITSFDINDDAKSVSNSKVFTVVRPGVPDGFRCDRYGNIWSSAHDGVHCYTPNGNLIGKILIPEQRTANCCWGDTDYKRLYIVSDTSLYSARLDVEGFSWALFSQN